LRWIEMGKIVWRETKSTMIQLEGLFAFGKDLLVFPANP